MVAKLFILQYVRVHQAVQIRDEKNERVQENLDRIYAVKEEQELRKNLQKRKVLWWQEFLIITTPLILWTFIFLAVLIFWPATPQLIETFPDPTWSFSIHNRTTD